MQYKRKSLSEQLARLKIPHPLTSAQQRLPTPPTIAVTPGVIGPFRPNRIATPPSVIRSRERRDVLPAGDGPGRKSGLPRPFFCRTCSKQTVALQIPASWYSLSRHTPEKAIRLGIYCSVACLIRQLPHLQAIEQDLAERGVRLEGTHQ